MSISATKSTLKEFIQKFNQLQNEKETLCLAVDSFSQAEWDLKLGKLTKEIKNLHETILNFQNLLEIKKKIKKRQKKRLKSKANRAKKQKSSLDRSKLNEKIDKWVERQEECHKAVIRNRELTKTSAIILSNVNKKIQDAERFLKTLYGLKQLRKLRANIQNKSDSGENAFGAKIDRLVAVWNDALKEYEREKSKLEMNLKYSSSSLEVQWNKVLFGDKFQAYSEVKKELSLAQFLDIRKTWDSYLVPQTQPHGFSIPIGWNLPKESASDKWSQYRLDAID